VEEKVMDKRKLFCALYGVFMISLSWVGVACIGYAVEREHRLGFSVGTAGLVAMIVLCATCFAGGLLFILTCCRKAEDEVEEHARARRVLSELGSAQR
jgi:putative copper export protein